MHPKLYMSFRFNPLREAPNDGGTGAGADADAAAKAKADADAKASATADAEAARKAATTETAKLAKAEAARKAAEADLAAARKDLERYKGIDPDKVRALQASEEAAEEAARLKRGEFDQVKKQMVDKHQSEMAQEAAKLAESAAKLDSLQTTIENLTVGNSFSASAFLASDTVLTGSKARKLYGDHFDVVEGEVVGFDKPRGAKGRAPLVDGSGANLGFEAALKFVINADPEKEMLLRAKGAPGAGSDAGKRAVEKAKKPTGSPTDRMAAILRAQK